MKTHVRSKRKPITAHPWLRPRNFLGLITTLLSSSVILITLLVILLGKPYQQSQDIRQQAAVLLDCTSMIDLPRSECEALKYLFESTNGPGWTIQGGEVGWLTTPRACEWIGVSCSGSPYLDVVGERHVIGIRLVNRGLSGQLPNIWGSLPQLSQLDLSRNDLIGSLADTGILSRTQLTLLNLSHTQLRNAIPEVFTNSHQLTTLDLSYTQKITGSVPTSLGNVRTLRQILLRGSGLNGPLPLSLQNLSLTSFLTAETYLCLPEQLAVWHSQIAQTDPMTSCSSVSGGGCDALCRENRECQSNLFCYFDSSRTGRCRLPANPTSAQCTVPPSATPTPTSTSAGGTTIVGCNQTCESNDNCSTNLRCYDIGGTKRCRLATNPSSDSCQGVADQGLNFSCNEYCSNSGECADNLTCWYNRCRDPENVSSVSCTPADGELRNLMVGNCGASCTSNRECVVNMRCYYGVCRLATNPTSPYCSAAVTTPYATSTPLPPKGGYPTVTTTLAPLPTASSSASPTPATATASAATSAAQIILEPTRPPATPTPLPTPTPKGPGFVERFGAWLANLSGDDTEAPSSSFGQTIQSKGLLIGMVVAGIFFLILGFLTGRKKKGTDLSRYPMPMPTDPSSPVAKGMIDRMKQKGIDLPK